MYVELYGLPGSGKSTIVNQAFVDFYSGFLRYTDYTHYIASFSKCQKIKIILRGLLRYKDLGKAIKNIASKNAISFRKYIRIKFKTVYFMTTLEVFIRTSTQAVVLDQGVFQRFCHLSYHISPDIIQRESNLCLLFDSIKGNFPLQKAIVVYLKETVECASERASKRQNPYAYDLIEEQDRINIYKCFEYAYNVASHSCRDQVALFFEIDNHNSLDKLKKILKVAGIEKQVGAKF